MNALRAGVDVIIDDGFWGKHQREGMCKRVEDVGAIPQLYYIKCSFATMKRRTLLRNKNLTKSDFCIDEKMFESYRTYFEEFGNDEEYVLVDNEEEKENGQSKIHT